MIGAKLHAIEVAEDRQLFKDAMTEIGLQSAQSRVVDSLSGAKEFQRTIGCPAIIRPSFPLGGTGSGIAFNTEEFDTIVARGLDISPVHEVLVEQSLLGWKEYE